MSAFSPVRRAEVVSRAGGRCEYCHVSTRGQVATFPIDHIIPRSAGGSTNLDNLALTCPRCNAFKWTAESASDPETGEPSRLFHPRHDDWSAHFQWYEFDLRGITPIGRATVVALQTNSTTAVDLRRTLAAYGLWSKAEAT